MFNTKTQETLAFLQCLCSRNQEIMTQAHPGPNQKPRVECFEEMVDD